jgi:hypothetical protein
MTHLSESEFVDLVEDPEGPGGRARLDPRRAAHVETCASCRDQADLLRAMLRQTAAVDVPEPSPLFWEHLSNRVRAGVTAEAAEAAGAARSGWHSFRARLVPLGVAAALFLAVFAGLELIPIGQHEGNRTSLVADRTPNPVPAAGPARPAATPDAENAEVWAVLTAAASDVALEDAHAAGMHVYPAAIDHAVQDLSAAERNELGRLLQSELKRASN